MPFDADAWPCSRPGFEVRQRYVRLQALIKIEENLQPDRYERRCWPGSPGNHWSICARSTMIVAICSRCIGGQLVVGPSGSWRVQNRSHIHRATASLSAADNHRFSCKLNLTRNRPSSVAISPPRTASANQGQPVALQFHTGVGVTAVLPQLLLAR
jgi:hypothetical protein